MKRLLSLLPAIAITAWVGGLWSVGYLAVPILFRAQSDKQLAGMLAGDMLNAVGYVGMICGGILLLQNICYSKPEKFWHQKNFWAISVMMIFSLIIQFGLSPTMADLKVQAHPLDVMHSAFADQFKVLHGISSILYLLESLLGLYLVVRTHASSSIR